MEYNRFKDPKFYIMVVAAILPGLLKAFGVADEIIANVSIGLGVVAGGAGVVQPQVQVIKSGDKVK